MKLTFKKFIILNLIIIILAISVYAIGYEYDKAYQLHPEAYFFSYDAAITAYGKRWERIAKAVIFLLLIFDLVIGFIWYRNKKANKHNESSIFSD